VTGGSVAADVIGVIAERDGAERLEGLRVVDADRAVASVGNPEAVVIRIEADALRLSEAGDGVDDGAGVEIKNGDCVGAEGGDEQAIVPRVERHVVDAAVNAGKRDGLFGCERRLCVTAGER